MSVSRVNISFESSVLQRIDDYCSVNGLKRSSFVSMACIQYIRSMEMLPSIESLMDSMSSIVDSVVSGKLSSLEAQSKLSSVEDSYKILTGKLD